MKEDLDSERVVINVGGTRHETLRSTLRSFPGTCLSRLEADSSQSEFFFDRDPRVFSYVLNYYRTGKLHCPGAVCAALVQDELTFWGLDEADLEACCWRVYHRHRPQLPQGDGGESGDRGRGQSWRQRIWDLFEDPHSSAAAMAVGIISLLFILASIVHVCISLQPIGIHDADAMYGNFTDFANPYYVNAIPSFFIIEAVIISWFSLEFLLRFFSCPQKMSFILNFMNLVDFVAILPFYLEIVILADLNLLRIARIVRILRVFRLFSRYIGLRVIGQTIRASITEFSILVSFLGIGVLIFATAIYFAENYSPDSPYESIQAGLWWAVVTMTTLGYGDMVPVTPIGKMVGALCALSAVLTIGMPIPVLVNNYIKCYETEKAKDEISNRKVKKLNPDVNRAVGNETNDSQKNKFSPGVDLV